MTRRTEAIALAVVLSVLALSGWMIYRAGEKKGATTQQLADNAIAIKAADKAARAADSVSAVRAKEELALRIAKDSALAQSKRSAEQLRVARAKVIVVGDTVEADGQTVDLPSVASLIRTVDSHEVDQNTTIAKLELDVAGLNRRVDALMADVAAKNKAIISRDERIKILEREKNPRFGFKSGLVAGGAIVLGILAAVGHR